MRLRLRQKSWKAFHTRGRDAAVENRTAVLNQIGASKTAPLIRELKRQLRALHNSIANLEAEIRRLIDADPALARRFEILTSIPGVGPCAAVALIAGVIDSANSPPKRSP